MCLSPRVWPDRSPDYQTFVYDRTAAVSYAEKFSCDGSTSCRNSAYASFNVDCTNFASQTAFAGGVPMSGCGPCRSEAVSNEWYMTPSSAFCVGRPFGDSPADFAWSNPWSTAAWLFDYFVNYMRYATASCYVICQNPDDMAGLVAAGVPGDIVQNREAADQCSSTTSAGLEHSMVLVKNGGASDGSTTLLTYHTGPQGGADVKDKSLKQMCENPSNARLQFVLLHIKDSP